MQKLEQHLQDKLWWQQSRFKTLGVIPVLLQSVCHLISDLMEEKPRQWHISTSLH